MQGRKHQCSYPITACGCANGTKKQQCSYPITTCTNAQAASKQNGGASAKPPVQPKRWLRAKTEAARPS